MKSGKKDGYKPRTLFYVGLESLESRYTLQLTEWNKRFLDKSTLFEKYSIVKGHEIDQSKAISVGQVLDAMGRPYYAMSQIQEIILGLRNGSITRNDTLFFEDMFHPGFETLPYIFNQLGWRPKVFVRCLAQTIDPDDFVHAAGMTEWMRRYEQMVNECVDAVLIASHEMASFMTAAGWSVPLIVTGLPFGKEEVRQRGGFVDLVGRSLPTVKRWQKRKMRVVFAARFDREKQPDFFVQLAKYWTQQTNVPVEFAFLSGKQASSNDKNLLQVIRSAVANSYVTLYENLKKDDYYAILRDSRVLFNCALQDWVSNTVSEADALDCNVLYPAYRSFPEVFDSDHTRLYVPWSIEDAYTKLRRLLLYPHPRMGEISDKQDLTIAKSYQSMRDWPNVQPELLIYPRDTEYRHRFSLNDRHVDKKTHSFWKTGSATDKQLLASIKESK